MKNILICGATGFIGRNLLDYFYTLDEALSHEIQDEMARLLR